MANTNENSEWVSDWEWELDDGDATQSSAPLLTQGQQPSKPRVSYREAALAPLDWARNPKVQTFQTPLVVKIFVVLIVAVILISFLPWHWQLTEFRPPLILPEIHSGDTEVILTNNSQCIIPNVPLRSDAYLSAATDEYTVSECGDSSKFTQFINSTTLKLLLNPSEDRRNCTVFEIDRPLILSSPNNTFVLKSSKLFDDANEVHDIDAEHVIVSCNVNGETTLDYHSRVLTNTFLKPKQEYWATVPKEELPVNVMVLVLDSISATDAFRHLPKTMKYLLDDLNFTYFGKHHAVGEPTLVNAIPLLVGVPAKTLFDEKKWTEHWDETEFVWKYFNDSNFATAYMEDIPAVGTFDYGGQKGFVHQPTDLYPRSLFTAWEALGGNSTGDNCIGTSPTWKYLYDYELEILRKLNNVIPSFTMPWLCWPFHDIFGTLGSIEHATLEFFQRLGESKDILENTVIFVMADHGFHTGDYAKSYEGLIERRLPLLLIRIPNRLTEFLPDVESVIDKNSKQVTSQYDIFQTLLALSQLGRKNENGFENIRTKETKFGRSLLEPLPENRSCDDAGIPKPWCACNLPEKSSSNRLWDLFKTNPVKLFTEKYVDRSRV